MNRRAFLKFLAAAPIVGPAVVKVLATVSAPSAPAWLIEDIVYKDFLGGPPPDYPACGACVTLRHAVTGELRRRAFISRWQWLPDDFERQVSRIDACGRVTRRLYAWVHEQNGRSALAPGDPIDQVQEGREERVDA